MRDLKFTAFESTQPGYRATDVQHMVGREYESDSPYRLSHVAEPRPDRELQYLDRMRLNRMNPILPSIARGRNTRARLFQSLDIQTGYSPVR